jgi:hypothetical protein
MSTEPGLRSQRWLKSSTILETSCLGQIDAEPLAVALVATRHSRARMTELFLRIALVDRGGRGEAWT